MRQDIDTKALRVGQEVATANPNSWGQDSLSTGWKVIRITPSGQVVVGRKVGDNAPVERRFDKNGCEIGVFRAGGKYSAPYLRIDVDAVRNEIRERLQRLDVLRAFDALRSAIPREIGEVWEVKSYHEVADRVAKALENVQVLIRAIGQPRAGDDASKED